VRFGESLRQIAQRTGVTIADLIRLNPGLEAARLVVGSEIRVAQSASGRTASVLGIAPTTSGGLSWPEMPGFGDPQGSDGAGINPTPFNSSGWIWPTQGVFSSGYGWRWGRMHKGIDVANNIGTPIVAAKTGRVVRSGWNDGGYGYLVELQHDDGSSTLYGHNSKILVRVGDVVEQGAVISLMGSTGNSTGPHLHFEIHPPGRGAVNPLPYLPTRA
jgi:murein DD-endopeptidase MepM/ murein hydrolase activator NlpD